MSTVTKGFEYDGAIMITASHLPFNRNGLKFFVKEGGLEKRDIASILSIATQLDKVISTFDVFFFLSKEKKQLKPHYLFLGN